MEYSVRVLKEKSIDPEFNIEFSYKDENVSINKSNVKIIRRPPRVTINYASDIQEIINSIDIYNRKKLELEMLHKIIDWLVEQGNPKRL